MSKKPTENYGRLVFGKDGSVRNEVFRLPDSGKAQEFEVAKLFASHLEPIRGPASIEMLPERDHDFVLRFPDGEIVVEATEVVSHDYLVPISAEEWKESRHRFRRAVILAPDRIAGVDQDREDNALARKIERKASRYPSKQQKTLWLLIWSVLPITQAISHGQTGPEKSTSTRIAELFVEANGKAPFDAIWVMGMEGKPYELGSAPEIPVEIHPLEDLHRRDQELGPGKQTNAMYVSPLAFSVIRRPRE